MQSDTAFIRVYRDGRAMGALFSRDIDGGESTWSIIEAPGTLDDQPKAGLRAVQLLVDRLPEREGLWLAWDKLR